MGKTSKRNTEKVPVQTLLEGEYLRVYRLHKELNNLSVVPHRHDHYEILLVTEGEGQHSINFKSYKLNPGRVFFLHPGQVHLIEEFERNGWLILFGEELFKRFLGIHHNEDDYGFLDSYSLNPFIDLSKETQESFILLMQQIGQELQLEKPDANILLHYVSLLLLQANRLHTTQHPTRVVSPRQKLLLQQLKKMVESHFKEQHQAAYYAEHLNADIKLLNSICRQSTGLTVYQLLQERLITESKILLQTTGFTVKEISYQLGFNDPAFFGRFFRKYTKTTPAAFRQDRIL